MLTKTGISLRESDSAQRDLFKKGLNLCFHYYEKYKSCRFLHVLEKVTKFFIDKIINFKKCHNLSLFKLIEVIERVELYHSWVDPITVLNVTKKRYTRLLDIQNIMKFYVFKKRQFNVLKVLDQQQVGLKFFEKSKFRESHSKILIFNSVDQIKRERSCKRIP